MVVAGIWTGHLAAQLISNNEVPQTDANTLAINATQIKRSGPAANSSPGVWPCSAPLGPVAAEDTLTTGQVLQHLQAKLFKKICLFLVKVQHSKGNISVFQSCLEVLNPHQFIPVHSHRASR